MAHKPRIVRSTSIPTPTTSSADKTVDNIFILVCGAAGLRVINVMQSASDAVRQNPGAPMACAAA
jgi:hypothetical protein